ncbi:uncharacterized protein TEOVI_000913600 [Trypanosoma equiperdum]|uniref:Uncharacterized protein n=3 Tax=Trypanozoon TaxID=39700 RepID=Q57YZ7_TRYB2|nr:hypothetical protein, conserved [Trypanosoma brucei brucei TREU927]AAX79677.1 hypothetical protein, conserved [Trypanosoma brucei]AAZ13081.1 hypothetical protein, conserved [Trypanosoma brucei brucei TREU927]RHW71142.1 hypothetical protein DPX39_080033600 [Trypanosoma brucei equiperdum]SCU66118.1 hypothetical protein, conserved [Trypanosoma equiperdum]
MFRISFTSLAGGLMRKAGRSAKGMSVVDPSAVESLSEMDSADIIKPSSSGSRKGRRSRRAGTEAGEEGKGESAFAESTGFVPVDNASMGIVGYKGKHSEAKVLELAERMQRRDITGEVPVASFAYEILKSHPSVRQMGLRERMSFLCDRWERLSDRQRKAYLDNPLKGLL